MTSQLARDLSEIAHQHYFTPSTTDQGPSAALIERMQEKLKEATVNEQNKLFKFLPTHAAVSMDFKEGKIQIGKGLIGSEIAYRAVFFHRDSATVTRRAFTQNGLSAFAILAAVALGDEPKPLSELRKAVET